MNEETTNEAIIKRLDELRNGLWNMAQDEALRDTVFALILTLYKVKVEEIQNLLTEHPLNIEQKYTVINGDPYQ
jgi:hypothetical protein